MSSVARQGQTLEFDKLYNGSHITRRGGTAWLMAQIGVESRHGG